MLAAYTQIQQCAHGKRDRQIISHGDDFSGNVRDMSNEQRKILAKWLGSCGKGQPDRGLEPEVFRILVDVLKTVE